MKRINPKTGSVFKRGEIREDGKVFTQYRFRIVKRTGFFEEIWTNPEKFKQHKLSSLDSNEKYIISKRGHLAKYLAQTRKRAKDKNIPFDLTLDYLDSISTENCPVFKTKFKWGRGNKLCANSPSLDRLKPELGYVKGNVVFISYLANAMKQNANSEQVEKLLDWMKQKNL